MAFSTPLVCWNTPCTPHKHPPASTATSEEAVGVAAASAGAGIARASSAAGCAIFIPRVAMSAAQTRAGAARRTARVIVDWVIGPTPKLAEGECEGLHPRIEEFDP